MKRFILSVAVVILASAWPAPAKAQYGFGGFGNIPDMSAEVDAMRSQQKAQASKYAKPQSRASRGAPARSVLSNPASKDKYGRMDLAGHPVAGYPTVRGDLSGPGATHVSRGGANGAGQEEVRAAQDLAVSSPPAPRSPRDSIGTAFRDRPRALGRACARPSPAPPVYAQRTGGRSRLTPTPTPLPSGIAAGPG